MILRAAIIPFSFVGLIYFGRDQVEASQIVRHILGVYFESIQVKKEAC